MKTLQVDRFQEKMRGILENSRLYERNDLVEIFIG